MINRRHPDINILPPPINNWITVCPYERCPISWARMPSIISSESESKPSVMHSVCLPKANLNRFKYRESEMLEVLNMERSTYYDRKKEAILLFGLSLWGTAIPKLKDFLESAREEEALCYCEC